MSHHLFRCGCNAICYEKKSINYGMVCAWSMQIDYDMIAMLLGSQSVTGNSLKIGDVVGVSSLAEGQEKISLQLGSNHSDKTDKFSGIQIDKKDHAILIGGAKVQMVCRVEQIHKLIDGCDDHFVVLKVLEQNCNKKLEFLPLEAVLPDC